MRDAESPSAKTPRKEGVAYSDLSFSVDEETQERIERGREELGRKLGLTK
ncbi:MAG: hypothetical protein Q7T81_03315 [Pseudolabrys sp.]|nr:hypothetical protein [Pseudolabrys sp.]